MNKKFNWKRKSKMEKLSCYKKWVNEMRRAVEKKVFGFFLFGNPHWGGLGAHLPVPLMPDGRILASYFPWPRIWSSTFFSFSRKFIFALFALASDNGNKERTKKRKKIEKTQRKEWKKEGKKRREKKQRERKTCETLTAPSDVTWCIFHIFGRTQTFIQTHICDIVVDMRAPRILTVMHCINTLNKISKGSVLAPFSSLSYFYLAFLFCKQRILLFRFVCCEMNHPPPQSITLSLSNVSGSQYRRVRCVEKCRLCVYLCNEILVVFFFIFFL